MRKVYSVTVGDLFALVSKEFTWLFSIECIPLIRGLWTTFAKNVSWSARGAGIIKHDDPNLNLASILWTYGVYNFISSFGVNSNIQVWTWCGYWTKFCPLSSPSISPFEIQSVIKHELKLRLFCKWIESIDQVFHDRLSPWCQFIFGLVPHSHEGNCGLESALIKP